MNQMANKILVYLLAMAIVMLPPTPGHSASFGLKLNGVMQAFGTKIRANDYVKSARRVWYRNLENRQRAMEKGWSSAVAVKSGVFHHMSETLRTMFIIWIISCYAIVKEEIRQSKLRGKDLNNKEVSDLALKSAHELLNNFEIYGAMLGAGVTSAAVKASSGQLNRLRAYRMMQLHLNSTAARQAFVQLIHSGVMSYITFVGWEVGATLWLDAMLGLGEVDEDSSISADQVRKDVEIAHNLKIGKSLKQLFFGKGLSEDEQRVLGKIFAQAGQILTNDEGRLWKLFYNAYRKRIAKGDFVVLVAAMSSAGYVGMKTGAAVGAIVGSPGGPITSAVVSGAFGIVFGLGAGVAGGVATLYVPESWKKSITNYYKRRRVRRNVRKLDKNTVRVESYMELFSNNHWKSVVERQFFTTDLDGIFKKRSQFRERIVDVWVEQYHDAVLMKQFAEYENSIGTASLDPKIMDSVNQMLKAQDSDPNAAAQLNTYLEENEEYLSNLQEDYISNHSALSQESVERVDILKENLEKIKKAEVELIESESFLKDFYYTDTLALGNSYLTIKNNSELKIPENIEKSYLDEINNLSLLYQNMRFMLFGFNNGLAKEFGVELEELSDEDIDNAKNASRVHLNLYYEAGYSEADVIGTLTDTSELPDEVHLQ